MTRQIAVIVHNIRSAHNVGSILRSAKGLGINHVYLTGYTPYPLLKRDLRLPHIAQKIDARITKTALGAENTQNWSHQADVKAVLQGLKAKGYTLAALDLVPGAVSLVKFKSGGKIALLLGSEIGGVDRMLLKKVDLVLKIPMRGRKESFNVAVAAAITMYHLCYFT